MGDETERRDVLASLTAQGVGPGVRVSELDHEEPTYDVPSVDADDDHVFRLAMSSAVLHDNPDEAADVVGVVWAIRSSQAGLSAGEAED